MSDTPSNHSQAREQAELLNAGYRYALSLAAERLDAEDLVHDAWLRLVGRYGNSPDKPLLFRTIRHIFIDNYRRNRRIDQHHHTIAAGDDHQISHLDESLADTRQLEKHLLKLRDVEREALFLTIVEGYTAGEIADINDCPRGTVLSLVHRAKQKLKASFSDMGQSTHDASNSDSLADEKNPPSNEQASNNVLSLAKHRSRK